MGRAVAICICGLLVFVAAPADAYIRPFVGTIAAELGTAAPVSETFVGMSTVNGSAGGTTVQTLRVGTHVGVTHTVPVTDPEVSRTVRSIRAQVTLLPGTFAPLSLGGTLTRNTLPVRGVARLCLIIPGCIAGASQPIPLTFNDARVGVGVGGLLAVKGFGVLRISLENHPWTVGTGMALHQTDNSGFVWKTASGFVHGAGSATSFPNHPSAVLQLVTPIQVLTAGLTEGNEKLSLFGTLRIHFIPEPGRLLLLGSGFVGLTLAGLRRARQRGRSSSTSTGR